MNIGDLKSCANCESSAFSNTEQHGIMITNTGCNEEDYFCENYSSWKWDKLTKKERAMQEIVIDKERL